MTTDLVGRTSERTAILAALGTARAVVLTGDAGIGKTAIWESTVAGLRAAGNHVLLSRASSAEARLPWVGMTDLLRSVPAEVIASLPAPQRSGLQALCLQTTADEALDERTVGTALHSTLAALAQTAPVLLAIDDLPYLDAASASVVAFALRRTEGRHPARLLATVRGSDLTLPVLQNLGTERVDVGPLTLGALFELLQDRLDMRLARPLLLRVHDTSGGNPLYALELARALGRLEISPQAGGPLPVPIGLDALVDARVRDLAPDVAEVVAATAASWRFSGTDGDADAIERAAAAGMVVVDDIGGQRVVRATHPLLGAAAYNGLSESRRRLLHARLADAADDPVERVRHAALAAPERRADLAEQLDSAVASALAAGVPDIASELAQLAVHHTLDESLRPARLDRLADAQLRSGDSSGARQTQLAALDATAPGPDRARRRIRLAEYTIDVTGSRDAEEELQAAVREAADEPLVLAEALITLSAITPDIDLGERSAQEALTLLEARADADPAILAGALAQVAGTRFRAGHGLDHEAFARAIALEQAHPFRRLSDRADASYAALLKYADDLVRSEELLVALREEAEAIGDFPSTGYIIGHLVQLNLWRGSLAEARADAENTPDAAMPAPGDQWTQARYNLAQTMAYQGELVAAGAILTVILGHQGLSKWIRHRVHAVLGFIALSRSDAQGAAQHLEHWHDALTAMHFSEPGYSRSHLDYFCALVGSGRIAEAEAFHTELDAQAQRSGRESAVAVALTGRAMIAAHAGRVDDARRDVATALAWYETSPLRFDRARTLLIAGQIHRRAKAKAEARALLSEAEAEFASFGAAAWRALAAAELSRVNVRTTAPAELTETERQVAELAASGLTNREVADRTFLAVKTVEANLARAYRKLGIRSRAELGARMGTTEL